MTHTATPWRVGRQGTVVADEPIPGMSGSDAVDYYGGHMVCESVTKDNAEFIALACNEYKPMLDQLAKCGQRVRELETHQVALVNALSRLRSAETKPREEWISSLAEADEVLASIAAATCTKSQTLSHYSEQALLAKQEGGAK